MGELWTVIGLSIAIGVAINILGWLWITQGGR